MSPARLGRERRAPVDVPSRHPTVLLEFPGAAPLAFGTPRRLLVARFLDEVRPALLRAERYARAGSWVAGFVAYEAAPAFDRALTVRETPATPLVWLAAFDEPCAWRPPEGGADAPLAWEPDMLPRSHAVRVNSIVRAIEAGDYYQVNLTLRMRACAPGSADAALALHQRLRAAQPNAYAAYVDTGDHQIVSASPELFFELRSRDVTMRPMKGTAPRGRWADEDDHNRRALAASEKDRAENLMIVDLVRNDLGRVAEIGTVRVRDLCAVEKHPTVWQMTSTVEGRLRDRVHLADLFASLFPCGSVTGAPKVAAMRAIAAMEQSARGVYCGAIGVLRPGGDATFSVAIRTATREEKSGSLEYGVGGGITAGSDAGSEYAEAIGKARVLGAGRRPRALVETLRLEDGEAVRGDRHLARLAASARYFDFADPTVEARRALGRARADCRTGRHRLRLVAAFDGSVEIAVTPLEPPAPEPLPVSLAAHRTDPDDVLLHHKTTARDAIDRERAARPELYDVLFANVRGELTEFGTGNLVLELGGALWTPPRDSGLLGGVFRDVLLERGDVRERILWGTDLLRASRIWLVSSLREWVPVRLV